MMCRNEKAFKPEAFLSPDRNYAPIYAWVWNGVLSEEKINRFKYESYFNIVWSELGNIKKRYTKKECLEKIARIVIDQEIIENIKKYKPLNNKNKIKKLFFMIKNKALLYWVIGT